MTKIPIEIVGFIEIWCLGLEISEVLNIRNNIPITLLLSTVPISFI